MARRRRDPITPQLVAAAGLSLLLAGCSAGTDAPHGPPDDAPSRPAPASSATSATPPPADPPASSSVGADPDSVDSAAVVVNKRRPLDPPHHVPAPLVDVEGHLLREDAAAAVTDMLRDMRADGVTVRIASGYRGHDEQAAAYRHWVARNGQAAADTVSARPGYSEHQTGLAVDLADGTGCDLVRCFASTGAGRWAAAHAHEYGLVLRYPDGAQQITGYAYEPWHFRFIGREDAARLVHGENQTLEEFYDTGPAPDYTDG